MVSFQNRTRRELVDRVFEGDSVNLEAKTHQGDFSMKTIAGIGNETFSALTGYCFSAVHLDWPSLVSLGAALILVSVFKVNWHRPLVYISLFVSLFEIIVLDVSHKLKAWECL